MSKQQKEGAAIMAALRLMADPAELVKAYGLRPVSVQVFYQLGWLSFPVVCKKRCTYRCPGMATCLSSVIEALALHSSMGKI